MPNGFMCPGGGANKIIIRARGVPDVLVQATLDGKTYSGTVGALGFVDIPVKKLGSYSVKVSKDGRGYTQTVNIYQYGITEFLAIENKPFAACTPEEIQRIARAGLAKKFWQIGDSINVTMKDLEAITLQIYDFDHDVGTDGNTVLPLTLGMKDCFKSTYPLNGSNTNTVGWENCNFRKSTLPLLKGNFPDEWQKIMTKCRKSTSAGNRSSSIIQTDDDLFLFSEIEMFGVVSQSFAGEGKIYPLFTTDLSRVKRVNNVADHYWERSPYNGDAVSYCVVLNTGSAYAASSSIYRGIALGFCVG